jgi:hypothetical protein
MLKPMEAAAELAETGGLWRQLAQESLGEPAGACDIQAVRFSQLAGFFPRQLEALEHLKSKKYILYGGAAGGGKSRFLRWACLWFLLRAWAVYGVWAVRVGLFCENYPALKDRHLAKIGAEFPRWLGVLKNTQAEGLVFGVRPELGGGVVCFRNLDDPGKYDSVEFAMVAVDELTRNREGVFNELRKRLRWPVQAELNLEDDPRPGSFPVDFQYPFLAATNPGNIGHAWVKRLWVDRDFPPELENYADRIAYIQSLATDNPYNPASYFEDLKSLPEPLRSAYAFGRWDVFVGQFFAEWRPELHVIADFPVPAYWRRFTASDWGYSSPACTLWYAVGPDNVVYVYREAYVRQLDTPRLGELLCRMSAGEQIGYRKLDPACWDTSRGPSIAEGLAAVGWVCEKADNNRLSGWERVRDFLAWHEDGAGRLVRAPQLRVFQSCVNLIRTLPAQVFDERNVNDLNTNGEDHAVDALRYGLMSRPGSSVVPLDYLEAEYREAYVRAQHGQPAGQATFNYGVYN